MDQQTQLEAQQIDAYYDSLLVDGMPRKAAQYIEQLREAAHKELVNRFLAQALNGYTR